MKNKFQIMSQLKTTLISLIFTLVLALIRELKAKESFTFNLNSMEISHSSPGQRYLSDNFFENSYPLYGNTTYLKYYYINIYIGNPPKKQAVLIDTGSYLATVPCLPFCQDCGRHINSYYDMRQSNTSRLLDCKSEFCEGGCSGSDDKCSFSIVSF